jgi:preprotein translocase subunit SecD
MQTHKTTAAALAMALCVGCTLFQARYNPTLRFYEQTGVGELENSVRTISLTNLNMKITVNSYPALTEKDIDSAVYRETPSGGIVILQFDPHGTFKLDELTTRQRGHYLVIVLDGHPVAAWLVDKRLSKGQFTLEPDISDEDAQKLVVALNRMGKSRR